MAVTPLTIKKRVMNLIVNLSFVQIDAKGKKIISDCCKVIINFIIVVM